MPNRFSNGVRMVLLAAFSSVLVACTSMRYFSPTGFKATPEEGLAGVDSFLKAALDSVRPLPNERPPTMVVVLPDSASAEANFAIVPPELSPENAAKTRWYTGQMLWRFWNAQVDAVVRRRSFVVLRTMRIGNYGYYAFPDADFTMYIRHQPGASAWYIRGRDWQGSTEIVESNFQTPGTQTYERWADAVVKASKTPPSAP